MAEPMSAPDLDEAGIEAADEVFWDTYEATRRTPTGTTEKSHRAGLCASIAAYLASTGLIQRLADAQAGEENWMRNYKSLSNHVAAYLAAAQSPSYEDVKHDLDVATAEVAAARTFAEKHARFHPDWWLAGGVKDRHGRMQHCDACDLCAALAHPVEGATDE